MSLTLKPFQKTFIKNCTRPDILTAALTLPRGNGKSTLAGYLTSRILTPSDPLFREGTESVLVAGSIEQARIVFKVAREFLGEDDYRYLDSNTRIGITHKRSRTRLRIIGSNGKTAMGLLNCPWAICDEPGAWEINGGQLVWDALATAQGKPGSALKILLVGTLAPLARGPGHWWYDLISDGTKGPNYVMAYQGDVETWDDWNTIRKANPLTSISPEFRAKLRQERDEARVDAGKKARFLSYRLNLPTADEASSLLNLDDWKAMRCRPVPPRYGQPIVGIDMGANRAWTAAVAIWENGRLEARALAPGIPSIEHQEKRDRVPRGAYQTLVDRGLLCVEDGLNVPRASALVDMIVGEWGEPALVVGDRFRIGEVFDAGLRQVEPRRSRWSEASEDIRGLRRICKDGPMAVDPDSEVLLAASLSAAMVKNDDAGNVRMVKAGTNNTGRDDVAAALVMAGGAFDRYTDSPIRGDISQDGSVP